MWKDLHMTVTILTFLVYSINLHPHGSINALKSLKVMLCDNEFHRQTLRFVLLLDEGMCYLSVDILVLARVTLINNCNTVVAPFPTPPVHPYHDPSSA